MLSAMKRMIAAVVCLLLTPSAAAGPGKQAETLQDEAGRLIGEVAQAQKLASARPALAPAPLGASLVVDLQRFGLLASRLSLDIDASGGPADLRCIFRGMAEETDSQLKSIRSAKTGAVQAAALARLAHMLEDAAEIAPLAQKQIAAHPPGQAAPQTCPVERKS
ncbi:MAG: hypothetical protein SGJ21_12550 [Alphaproteobacteria bacterium]|nr:hypothetical protein [Alphaproteobacteria bacterium]